MLRGRAVMQALLALAHLPQTAWLAGRGRRGNDLEHLRTSFLVAGTPPEVCHQAGRPVPPASAVAVPGPPTSPPSHASFSLSATCQAIWRSVRQVAHGGSTRWGSSQSNTDSGLVLISARVCWRTARRIAKVWVR